MCEQKSTLPEHNYNFCISLERQIGLYNTMIISILYIRVNGFKISLQREIDIFAIDFLH